MNLEKYKILVIEDDVALQEAASMKLSRAGFTTFSALSAEQGILHLSNNQIDFIWLDMYLPGISGLQFLEQLRNDLTHKETPVMIVSACSSNQDINRAFDLKIVKFVTKSEHSIKDIVSEVALFFNKNVKQQSAC